MRRKERKYYNKEQYIDRSAENESVTDLVIVYIDLSILKVF